MNPNRVLPGEIYWVRFPARGGHAQAGRRPAIIFQSESTIPRLPTLLVIPLTSQKDALRFPGTIYVDTDESNGLPISSVALVFQLTVVDKTFLEDRLGVLNDEKMHELRATLEEVVWSPTTEEPGQDS